MTTKVCTKCGEEKPLSEFLFRKKRDKYNSACKVCEAKQKKGIYRKKKNGKCKHNSKKLRPYEIKERCIIAHGYKYSYPNLREEWANLTTLIGKITIICPHHGVFYSTVNNHIYRGSGCPACYRENHSDIAKASYYKFSPSDPQTYNGKSLFVVRKSLDVSYTKNIRKILRQGIDSVSNQVKKRIEYGSGTTIKNLLNHLMADVDGFVDEYSIEHLIPRSFLFYYFETDPQFRACWHWSNLKMIDPWANSSRGNRVPLKRVSHVMVGFSGDEPRFINPEDNNQCLFMRTDTISVLCGKYAFQHYALNEYPNNVLRQLDFN